MRLTLCGFITSTWEDVAPEVAVYSLGNTYLQDTLGLVVVHRHYDKLIRHLLCMIWTGFCILWLLVRSPVVEITVCTADETQ